MDLLAAVNTGLPYFGEFATTSITDPNPVVQGLLEAFRQQADLLLAEGYVFNTRDVQLAPDDTGRIKAPMHVLAVYSLPQDNNTYSVRGDYLWCVNKATWYFDAAVRICIVERLDFTDLPSYAAQVCMYRGIATQYLANFGVDSIYQQIMQQAQMAYVQLQQEELRQQRYVMQRSTKSKWQGWLRR